MFPFANDGNDVSGVFTGFDEHDTNGFEIDIPLLIFFQSCLTVLQREPHIGTCETPFLQPFQRLGAIGEAVEDRQR